MENFKVYRDIQARTGGDIYIGVVGPVRTGKSTFIRRFMELVALPSISEGKRAELQDELPLSGAGKMITTVEPKFIPKEAVDYYTKLFKYRTAGVREYWIVDPVKKLVMVYDFENEDAEQYTFQDSIKVGIYEELRIDFAEM